MGKIITVTALLDTVSKNMQTQTDVRNRIESTESKVMFRDTHPEAGTGNDRAVIASAIVCKFSQNKPL